MYISYGMRLFTNCKKNQNTQLANIVQFLASSFKNEINILIRIQNRKLDCQFYKNE